MKKFASLALLSLIAVLAFACDAHAQEGHEGHNHVTTMEMSVPPSTKMYKDAMNMMHQDMDIEYTGNTDVDFVRGMIPHHQGAIDMANIVIKEGKDPEIRKLAEEIVKAQKAEIATMKAWLAKHDKDAGKATTKPSAAKTHQH